MSSLPVRCESEHLLHGVCVIIIIIISSSSSMPIPGGSLVLKRECMYSMTGLLIYCSNAVIAISYYNTFVIIFTRIIFNFVRQVNGNNYKSKSTKREQQTAHTHIEHIYHKFPNAKLHLIAIVLFSSIIFGIAILFITGSIARSANLPVFSLLRGQF